MPVSELSAEQKGKQKLPPGADPLKVSESYCIGGNMQRNADGSAVDYGPWKIRKSGDEDRMHYSLELDAMLMDDTGRLSLDELQAYKTQLESSFENTYARGEGWYFDEEKNKRVHYSWTGKLNLQIAHANVAANTDCMHVRIRPDGEVPNTEGGKGMGYAQAGYSVVYLNEKVLNHAPAVDGIFKGSGLGMFGQPSLERTFSHHVFSTLNLMEVERQTQERHFPISRKRFNEFHEGKNLMEGSRKFGQPNPKAGNSLIPDQLKVMDEWMDVRWGKKKMKS